MADPAPHVAVYALDVGQGDTSFVVANDPSDGVLLFDCNDTHVAERFVVDHGIETLHAVVISHLDQDHIRGMLPFLRGYLDHPRRRVEHVFVGTDRDRKSLSKIAYELLDGLFRLRDEHGFVLHAPHREASPRLVHATDHWQAELVLPRYGSVLQGEVEGDDPNHFSVVLRITCGDRAVLIGGDAPLVSWEQLEPALLQADAIRSPHHGGGIREGSPSWTEADLYDRVGADTVVVSCGTHNPHGHPTDQHLAGIAPGTRRLLCTQLTPRCHEDLTSVRGEMLRGASRVAYAYRHRGRKEVPCAGSILVELLDDGTVRVDPPREGWHDQLLDRMHLATPRCRP